MRPAGGDVRRHGRPHDEHPYRGQPGHRLHRHRSERARDRRARQLDDDQPKRDADLRSGKVAPRPAGRFWGRVALGAILALFGISIPTGMYALLSQGDDANAILVGVVFFSLLGLAIAIPGILMIATSRATTPQRALSLFYKSIGRGKMGEARDYVAAREAAEKALRAHAQKARPVCTCTRGLGDYCPTPDPDCKAHAQKEVKP